jgi:hypothetical protein
LNEWRRPVGHRGEASLTTSISLLHRLRDGADPRDWERFVRLYTPLLLRRARRVSAQDADVVQEVFVLLFHKLPSFDYDGTRSFRAGLPNLASRRAVVSFPHFARPLLVSIDPSQAQPKMTE